MGVIYFVGCKSKSKGKIKASANKEISNVSHHTTENMFADLRNMALSVSPAQLGITLSDEEIIVYGVLMDWGIDNNTATIISYQTGDASMYLSSGGGTIGGVQHETVNIAARQFVNRSQYFLTYTTKTENTTSLPDKD